MLDTIYKILLTLLNKEQQGYVTPTEFNLLAANVQNEIFREYFEDENRDKLKENRGMTGKGYSNLDFNVRQRIQQFSDITSIAKVDSKFTLPEDLYFIEDDGVLTGDSETYSGRVIEEVERNQLGYLSNSIAKPTALYPIYGRYSDSIVVEPTSIEDIKVNYLRTPKAPNWTYIKFNNQPLFNPADLDFQDFELHESESTNIVLKMLTYFGISIRERDIVEASEILKDKQTSKENN